MMRMRSLDRRASTKRFRSIKINHNRFIDLNRTACLIGLQGLLIVGAIALGTWVEIPPMGIAGLCVLGLSIVVARRDSGVTGVTWRKRTLAAAWAGVILVPCSLATARFYTLDSYYALLAWTIAAAVLLAGYGTPGSPGGKGWKVLALTCAFAGSLIWLASAYAENLRAAFYFGLFVNVALLVLCRVWFRLGGFGIQTIHTMILLLVGLPFVDLFIQPSRHFDKRLLAAKKYYQFEAAKRDPVAFADWWQFYNEEWRRLERSLFDHDVGLHSLRPRPNARGAFFDSPIAINSKGFRGREFSTDKAGAYRIVALGESTTFGLTLTADDKPWSELLEEMIRQRLKPNRRVEVINAGVPANNLSHSLRRLATDILPLQPDMIISYHGFNGFPMLYWAIPPVRGRSPPGYRLRPIKLLADYEYRFKLLRYKQRLLAGLVREPPGDSDPMKSEYARAYEKLITAARTNKIRLVLANFSMAVNQQSQPDVVQFYRVPFPVVHWQIELNTVHSTIVQQLARQHPEVCTVDTHLRLDGEHDKFVDLVHLTQDGREQLAENMFAGIRECLLRDWAGQTDRKPLASPVLLER
jgi:lysophospholipase L1-like esterase